MDVVFYSSQEWRDTAKCDKVAIAQNVSSLLRSLAPKLLLLAFCLTVAEY